MFVLKAWRRTMYRTIINGFSNKLVLVTFRPGNKRETLEGRIREDDDIGILFEKKEEKYPTLIIAWKSIAFIELLEKT